MLPLQALTPARLARACNVSLDDARLVVAAIHRDEPLDGPLPRVRRTAKEAVRARGFVPSLHVRAKEASKLDPFVKYGLCTHDDQVIETVRIPLEKAGRF